MATTSKSVPSFDLNGMIIWMTIGFITCMFIIAWFFWALGFFPNDIPSSNAAPSSLFFHHSSVEPNNKPKRRLFGIKGIL